MAINHIAIIMDGNGRWAERRGLPRSEGHREGVRAAGRVARAALKMKVPFLTLYALSTENLCRPREELEALGRLMREYLDREVPALVENDSRLRVIGDRSLLSGELRDKIETAERMTRKGTAMTLCLAVCYGGRDEIVRAVRGLAAKTDLTRLTERAFSRALDTAGMPDPDLLIRTGGDCRVSNFLLWEMAYTELYFSRVLWPAFYARHLKAAVASFHRRQRRFGRRGDGPDAAPCPPKRGRRTFK